MWYLLPCSQVEAAGFLAEDRKDRVDSGLTPPPLKPFGPETTLCPDLLGLQIYIKKTFSCKGVPAVVHLRWEGGTGRQLNPCCFSGL